MPWANLDLSTAVLYGGVTTYADGMIQSSHSSGLAEFYWADLALDPATTYPIEVDYLTHGDSNNSMHEYIYSSLPGDPNASNWFALDWEVPRGIPAGTAGTFYAEVGPGLHDWADAMAAGETMPLFETKYAHVTAVRIFMPVEVTPYLPPRRVFPRDDGRAASSAPRSYPASKAAQAGNRIASGYV